MAATLDKLQALVRKVERVHIDEHDRGLLFVSGDEKALLSRLTNDYLIEAEEILAEGSISSGVQNFTNSTNSQ